MRRCTAQAIACGMAILLCASAMAEEKKPKPRSHFVGGSRLKTTKELKSHTITIKIKNGHIGQVILGCREGATDGFDLRVDDLAPPPGIGGVAYTYLLAPDKKWYFYKDIREYAETVEWVFHASITKLPVTLTWKADEMQIPEGFRLMAAPWDGKSEKAGKAIDCSKVTEIGLTKTGNIRFTLAREKKKAE